MKNGSKENWSILKIWLWPSNRCSYCNWISTVRVIDYSISSVYFTVFYKDSSERNLFNINRIQVYCCTNTLEIRTIKFDWNCSWCNRNNFMSSMESFGYNTRRSKWCADRNKFRSNTKFSVVISILEGECCRWSSSNGNRSPISSNS